jgi:phospholipid transport system substrate-binding protein
MISRNKLFMLACFTCFLAASSAYAEDENRSPTAFIEKLVDDNHLESKIDFDTVTKEALGVHWDSASVTQRQDAKKLLRRLMKSALERHFEEIRTYPVEYTGESVEQDKSVVSLRTLPKPEVAYDPTEIVFHLQCSGKSYVVQDIDIEGVSLVKSYRNQFHKIIAKSGIDALLHKMSEKVKNPGPAC